MESFCRADLLFCIWCWYTSELSMLVEKFMRFPEAFFTIWYHMNIISSASKKMIINGNSINGIIQFSSNHSIHYFQRRCTFFDLNENKNYQINIYHICTMCAAFLSALRFFSSFIYCSAPYSVAQKKKMLVTNGSKEFFTLFKYFARMHFSCYVMIVIIVFNNIEASFICPLHEFTTMTLNNGSTKEDNSF